MELVYLWVEDYKNIKKQGFNFSPKFYCEYNDIKKELTINENDDYIPNFFGENINVTAIVGKNGSGKSNLLNYINDTPRDSNKILIYKNQEIYYCSFFKEKPILRGSFLNINLIYSYEEKFYPHEEFIAFEKNIGKKLIFTYLNGHKFYTLSAYRENNYSTEEKRFFIPKYIQVLIQNTALIKQMPSFFNFDILKLTIEDNSTKFLLQYIKKEVSSFKNGQVSTTIDNQVIIYEMNEKIDFILKSDNFFYNRKIVYYNRDRKKLVEVVKRIEQIHIKQTSNSNHFGANKHFEFELSLLISFIEYYLKYSEKYWSCKFLLIQLEELLNKIEKSLVETDIIRIREPYMLSFFESLIKEVEHDIFNKDANLNLEKILKATKYMESKHIHINDDGYSCLYIPIDSDCKENIHNIAIFQKIFNDEDIEMSSKELYLRIFKLDLINSKTNAIYESISEGEKQFTRFAVDFISLFNRNLQGSQLIIPLADEIENHMHPKWKKEILFHTINIVKEFILTSKNNINIHIIFSTHSPFLLSDISKENIIFLDTYKKEDEAVKNGEQKIGNCKVLSHDEVLSKKQTFGANIHTLLSDSFFMDNGLMGEFAKNKINKIIRFLNGKNRFIDFPIEYIEKVINSIGEPFLKQKLSKMYFDKFDTKKQDRIKELKAELKRLENG